MKKILVAKLGWHLIWIHMVEIPFDFGAREISVYREFVLHQNQIFSVG